MLPECIYTIEELKERLAYWKDKLHLQDWNIDIQIVPVTTMVGGNWPEAELLSCYGNASAKVRIIRPEDYAGAENFFPQNMEQALVHELLHLYYSDIEPDEENKQQYNCWHRKLDNMATLLVEMEGHSKK